MYFAFKQRLPFICCRARVCRQFRQPHKSQTKQLGLDSAAASNAHRMSAQSTEQGMQSSITLPKVVIITGPTGVGKTAVGLRLAELIGGEVVSADSVQVYKGLDIGSDKLPVAERKGITHHLLDVCDLVEEYSAGRFHDEARAAIQDIIQRGRTPVVVGGTGFYLRLLVEGKPATAKATPEQEAAVQHMLEQAWADAAEAAGLPGGAADLDVEARWQAGVALLGKLGDQEAMTRIGAERNNYYRLKRALHILHTNPGKTMKELDLGSITSSTVPEYDWRPFFLHRPRLTLYKKVDLRLQEMVLSGLLDEAAALLQQGLLPGSNMAASAVGYRQAMEWLLQAVLDTEAHGQVKTSLETVVGSIASATHRLIRTQMTWFRDRKEYKWLDMDELGTAEAAADMVLNLINQPQHEGQIVEGAGLVSPKEQQKTKQWTVDYSILRSRQDDVTALMKHVQDDLVPKLASCDETRAAIQLTRDERAAQSSKAHERDLRKAMRRRQAAELAQENLSSSPKTSKKARDAAHTPL